MRGDNVEAILVADRDLTGVVRDRPELARIVLELHLTEGARSIEVGVHGIDRSEGVSTEKYLRAEPSARSTRSRASGSPRRSPCFGGWGPSP